MAHAGSFPGSFEYFFDLPPEIRTQILSLLVLSAKPVYISPLSRTVIPFPHALFLSHPLLYLEASTLFYEQNIFVLDLVTGSRAAIERALATPADSDDDDTTSRSVIGGDILRNERARRRIRHLHLIPGRLGMAFTAHVRPFVADMLLAGALRHLKIAIYPTGPKRLLLRGGSSITTPNADDADPLDVPVLGPPQPSWTPAPAATTARERQADEQYASSDAFRGLLRLLADPALETAELWVPPVHRALFCEFHGDDDACQFSPRGGRCAWRLVQVDWRGLARRCLPEDHEMHIVRVGD